jgi:catechol 2,3-dioxygenase
MTNRLISHLAHVEILTPKIEESIWFFEDLLKMYVVKRDGRSAYLRAWGEFYVPFSLRLTESDQGGLGHVAWRADSQEDLNKIAQMAQANGSGIGWTEGEWAHGKAYRFKTPDGHVNEVFWEMEKYTTPPEWKSKIKARPMKMPNGTAAVRRLDHCTLFASDVKAVRETYQHFGMKLNEGFLSSKQNRELGAFLTANIRDHEVGIINDITGAKGRLNHVAFHLENIGMWIEGCDVFVENGIFVEMGPLRHGVTDSFGLYVIEPGGNRVEMFHGGYLNFVPTQVWEPIWSDVDAEEGRYGTTWGLGLLVETWQSYGTPVVPISPQVKSVLERLRENWKQDPYHPKNPKAVEAK